MSRPKTEEEKLMPCEICGSLYKVFLNQKTGKRLCAIHRQIVYRKGGLYRTHKEPNEIICHEDYAEVILYDKNNREQARCAIDLTDISLISQYKWFLHSEGYAGTNIYKFRQKIFMHRLIMGNPKGLCIDHVDHNKLNNRKSNLRLCTPKENSFNQKIRNPSGAPGVRPTKFNSWVVQIGVNRQQIYLGTYKNLEDAIRARIDGEIKYFGFSSTLEQRSDIYENLSPL